MQRTIQKITQQFVDRLPDNDQYYRLDDLHSWGIPSFIVRRIKVELERNLAESMIIPKTDWANTKSNAVVDAWQKFVDAIRAEARLPASYGKTVIETAVADVVEMLVQPRKNIPLVIFGAEDKLTRDEIRHRLKAAVVYPHFSRLIPRYMEKKNMETFSKERCQKIVSEADQKLISGYSPLNWAQMLEPLFSLMDGAIDTNLLRLFFEDKNMPRIARKFDLMNDSLTRAKFIEVLSSPDLLDFEGYEDDQSSLFDDQPDTEKKDQKSQKAEKVQETGDKNEEPAETESEAPSEKPEENNRFSDLLDKEKISAMLFPDEKGKKNPDEDEDDKSLNAVFRDPDEESTNEKSVKKESKKEKEHSDPEKEPEKSGEGQAESKEDSHQKNGHEKASGNEENTPIWMRYMSEEELEEYQKEQEQEETDEDGFIEEPIIDLTKEDATEEEVKKLKKLLRTERELFVEEIFRGSERAFDEAVEEIAGYDRWRDVSKYIDKKVFKRNLVDMYSEAAVDFTDRLQTYFLEKQN